MMTTLKWFKLPLLLLLLASCSEMEEGRKNHREERLIDDSGFFRGYRMGWSPDTLLLKEKWTPEVSSDSTIEYHKRILAYRDSVRVNAYLAFDTYGLFEIQVDLFFDSDSMHSTIEKEWSEKLTFSFGEPESLLTTKRWTTFSESNNLVEISLSQERTISKEPFISLNYLEPLNDEY